MRTRNTHKGRADASPAPPTEETRAAIGRRIVEVRGTVKQEAFAEKLGIHAVTLGRYERGERLPGTEFLLALASTCDVSADWVLYGIPPQSYSDTGNDRLRLMRNTRLCSSLVSQHPDSAVAMIPVYNIRTIGGHTALLRNAPAPEYYAFSKAWLTRKIDSPFDRLALVTVAGNSVPGLLDGDIVMIDRGDDVLREGVYVFQLEERIYVKPLSLRAGQFVIEPAQPLSLLQHNATFKLIGRVVGQPVFKRC